MEQEAMTSTLETQLRRRIAKILADGLVTQTEPYPEDHREFDKLLVAIHDLPPGDLEAKLVLSGLVNEPHGPDAMCCHECMYYLVNRRWCDLPEMSLPVQPEWWCRFWRI